MLSCVSVSQPSQAFLAALIQRLLPELPLLIMASDLKRQEGLQQDLATWLNVSSKPGSPADAGITPLYYPPWEILPHEDRLPHPDVVSERLETLVALSKFQLGDQSCASEKNRAPIIVTSVAALLQKTFPPGAIRSRTRTLKRGDRIEPLDLIEWLEEQGYEPEAQVTQKGEIALRGGIVDLFPLTSPWPVRLEFFGDELESLRQFDPHTQISRGEIDTINIPPGGELGILKQANAETTKPESRLIPTDLIDYLPPRTILLLCEPEQLDARADEYENQLSAGDSFFVSWTDFKERAIAKQMTLLSSEEGDQEVLTINERC